MRQKKKKKKKKKKKSVSKEIIKKNTFFISINKDNDEITKLLLKYW